MISDWQHFAILELTHLKNFKSCPKWVAETLDLSETLVQESIERLVNIGALDTSQKNWQVIGDFKNNMIDYEIPSDAVKNFHIQCIKQIMSKIFLPIEVREFSSTMLPLDEKEYQWIRQEIKNFKSKILDYIDHREDKEALYLLGIQLTPISKIFAGGKDV